ncbi:MAG TPA: penicillin acylase family protein [Syntrophus sp. (in: bacteria)]|nr:penicillin acylase family protein [Syntrophus sp. (in: bacteria)]
MKWLKAGVVLAVILILAVVAGGMIYLRVNSVQREGEIRLSGLQAPVRVVRDGNGTPYIYAQTLDDLLFAQGFVTAQDRLFQMQLTRMFAAGRIAEMVGEKARNLDIRMRTIGFVRQARRHEAILDVRTRRFLGRYLEGVNAFIRQGRDLPVEFKLAGIRPEPWGIADSLSVIYLMGWDSAANLKSEIVARMLVERLGPEKAREIFPLNINPDERARDAGAGFRVTAPREVQRQIILSGDAGLIAFLKDEKPLAAGSNNWAVGPKRSASGKPIVANDPHLDARILPGPWYPAGLVTPAFRAVGVTIPGVPGIIAGRNDRIAIGMTNAYGDAQDLFIETLDPRDPGRYLEGRVSRPFQVVPETIRIRDKKAPDGFREETVQVRLTRRGPVISGLFPGLKAEKLEKAAKVVTVRWSPFETMGPSLGLERLFTARSVGEVRQALGNVTTIMLNFVFADVDGHIGWQTTGRLPIRARGDGLLPVEVRDGGDPWRGWIPYAQMPARYDPPRGWLGTCNHKTVTRDYPYAYSTHLSPAFRYRRLAELMNAPGKVSAHKNWLYQRDTMNLLARDVAPVMARILLGAKETEQMGRILNKWDYYDYAGRSAPAIFQAVWIKFARRVFQDELGPELAGLMLDNWYFWEERLRAMVLAGESPWFDDVSTPRRETMADLFQEAGREAARELGDALGDNPARWQWGKLHRIEFVSPLRREGFGRGLVGGGSHPMGGSPETLYRAIYDFNKPYAVNVSASLRMVADLGDPDRVYAVLPGGVSGRLFDRHNRDQIRPFMDGEKRAWWFSDAMIERHAKYRLELKP